MVVDHDVPLPGIFQGAAVADDGSGGAKPGSVFPGQPSGLLHAAEDLHPCQQLPGLALADPEGLQLPLLATPSEEKPLVGEQLQLSGHVGHLLLHPRRVGQDLVAVEHLLQKPQQFPVQALDGGLDLAAVVVGEDQGVDDEAHRQADGGIPDPSQGIAQGLDVRGDAQRQHDQAGQRR